MKCVRCSLEIWREKFRFLEIERGSGRNRICRDTVGDALKASRHATGIHLGAFSASLSSHQQVGGNIGIVRLTDDVSIR